MRPFLLKVLSGLLGLLLVFALFQSCNKDEMKLDEPAAMHRSDAPALVKPDVALPDNAVVALEDQKPFTLNLADYPNLTKKPVIENRLNGCEDGLSPTLLTATLASEESMEATLTACLDPVPPSGDVLFCMDLTGSMGGALYDVQTNSCEIMDAVRDLIANTNFGLITHTDYPGSYYDYCGYSNNYGAPSDYPYILNQPITDDCIAVSNAISALGLGSGADGPECYARPFWEACTDDLIGWRDGAAKILLAFLDNYPHDCDVFEDGTTSYGGDPGPDGIANTADDLDFHDVIDLLAAENITLIVIESYNHIVPYWDYYASQTGGVAVALGTDIIAQITDLIEEAVGHIDELTIVPSAYASWVSTDPVAHEDIDLEEQQTRTFDVTITVPPGTPDGTYEFDLKLMGDGAEYGSTHVVIEVVNVVEVGVDIHPGSCPNPLNTKAKGVIPVSICGTDDFDVADIDVSTVRLAGVAPLWEAIDDDSTPYEPFVDKPLNIYSCNEMGPDGYLDLKLKFNNQQVIAALGPLMKGDIIRVILTGELYDGTPIIGEDIVKIAN